MQFNPGDLVEYVGEYQYEFGGVTYEFVSLSPTGLDSAVIRPIGPKPQQRPSRAGTYDVYLSSLKLVASRVLKHSEAADRLIAEMMENF